MNRFFSRSPITSKKDLSPKSTQKQLFDRKFQQCTNSEQDFVRNVGFFIEKLKLPNQEAFLRKTIDRIKALIKASKSSQTEKFLSLLLLKTLFECDETLIIARYSADKILRRLKLIAEKSITSASKGFSPFFMKKLQYNQNKTNESKVFLQLLLECLKFWGFKYKPHLLEKGLGEYRKTYQYLVNKGVIFPENYRFFWKETPFFKSKDSFKTQKGDQQPLINIKPDSFEKTPKKIDQSQKEGIKATKKENSFLKPDSLNKNSFMTPSSKNSRQNISKMMKNEGIVIKSRSCDDMDMSNQGKNHCLKQLKLPLTTINIEDFLSKISSNGSTPLQTPSPKEGHSFIIKKETNKKKIEGLLIENERKSFKFENIVEKEKKANLLSNTSIEENILEIRPKLEKTSVIKKEEEKSDFIENSFNNYKNNKENQLLIDKMKDSSDILKPFYGTETKSYEEIHINDDNSLKTTNFKENQSKKDLISSLKQDLSSKTESNILLTQQINILKKDFSDMTNFCLILRSELDQSLLKNADLILQNESARREKEKLLDYKKDCLFYKERIKELENHFIEKEKLKMKYEDLQFQYEGLFNEKMSLEIQRKKLKMENQELMEDFKALTNDNPRVNPEERKKSIKKIGFREEIEGISISPRKKTELSPIKQRISMKKTEISPKRRDPSPEKEESIANKVSPDKNFKLTEFSPKKYQNSDINSTDEQKYTISDTEEPNFFINRSFDSSNLKKSDRNNMKNLSFYENRRKMKYSFQYIEENILDNDLSRLSKLIKTDKFLNNEENFKKFCLLSEGKLLENENLTISFEYREANNKEIILMLAYYNKTELEITCFQSKVLNPRSKIYY